MGFIVGSSALSFQILVIYPWHHELAIEYKKVKELKEQQDHRLDDYNAKKMEKIHQL